LPAAYKVADVWLQRTVAFAQAFAMFDLKYVIALSAEVKTYLPVAKVSTWCMFVILIVHVKLYKLYLIK
jgi:hypothetical protein